MGKYEWFEDVGKFNTKGYLWVKRNSGKWGLIDFKGKTILKSVYDSVDFGEWHNGKNGNAIVTKKGSRTSPLRYNRYMLTRMDTLSIRLCVTAVMSIRPPAVTATSFRYQTPVELHINGELHSTATSAQSETSVIRN